MKTLCDNTLWKLCYNIVNSYRFCGSTVIVLEFLSDNTCTLILYGGKLWWTETLANLASDHKFAKVSPANLFNAIKNSNEHELPFP